MRYNLYTTLIIYFLCGLFPNLFGQVTEEWVRRINSPANLSDHAHDIATDPSGNSYVTGWIEVSPNNTDCYTVKYSPDGTSLWEKTYTGSANGLDYGYTIAVDENGNSYVGGFGSGDGPLYDTFILKYNTFGDTVWTTRWTSPGGGYSSYIYSIAVDMQENVYVTGFMSDGFTGGEFITFKYNAQGVMQWFDSYKGPGSSIDYANCIIVDNTGNVYIAGWSGGENNLHDMTTIKYSPEGSRLWVQRYNGSANDNDYAYWLDLDPAGNVYVTGQSVETGSNSDITTIKYSPDGDVIWIEHYNGTGNNYDAGWAIEVDDEGNSFITGNHTTVGGLDCVTLKYTTDGDLAWATSYNGPGNSGDLLLTIAIDDSSNSYVSGFVSNAGAAYDIATIKYNSDGVEQWVQLYDGAGSYDGCYAVTIDESQNVFVAGYSIGNGTDYDYTTIKYSQGIIPVELVSFTATAEAGNIILNWQTATETNNYGFEIERSSNITDFISVGFINGNGTTLETNSYSFIDNNIGAGKYYYRLKQVDYDGSYAYSQIAEIDYSVNSYDLMQNYPNPFNPQTTISFSLPKEEFVTLKVYNSIGQEVTSLLSEIRNAGSYSIVFDGTGLSSGIYFYTIKAGEFTSKMKMILLK